MKKRMLSLVLCLCLTLLLLPTAALAAGGMTVSINGVSYTAGSLEAAIGLAIDDTGNATATSLDTIASIEITAGEVEAADWDYIKNIQNNVQGATLKLKALTVLTVADEVTAVADLPENFLLMSFTMPTQSPIQRVQMSKLSTVAQNAFRNCPSLASASFPDTVSIGPYAFDNCPSLTSASFPKAKSIASGAFKSSGLTSASFPKATSIGGYAFERCTSLTSVSFPKAESIDLGAFDSSGLTSASFPKVTSIQAYAFAACASLTSASFPATPPTVVDKSFSGTPAKRYLTLVAADGTPLAGEALDTAIATYQAVNDGNTSDNLWYGWTLPELPQITTQPTGAAVTVGSSVTLSVTASGFPPPSYQWYKDGVEISGATNTDYTIHSAVVGDAGSYTCIASNSHGSDTSLAAVLTVNIPVTAAPQFISTTDTMSSSSDVEAAFTLTAPPAGNTIYRVYAAQTGGTALADVTATAAGTALTLTFSTAPTASGTYFISAQTDGETESSRTAVSVNKYVSGGGYSSPTYPVTVSATQGGSVTASPKSASTGATVTVTLKPDEGKQTDKITVTDKDGKEITVLEKSGGAFSFQQPRGGATVTVTFKDVKWENPFTDVSETDWFFEDVMFVFANKLMIGTSETTFSPYGTTTRAMVATTIWRMEGEPDATGANGFTDVESGKWYTEAITWAAANKIVDGYGNAKFGPEDPITREQMAAILYRYAAFKGYDVSKAANLDAYTDAGSISSYALAPMKWANANGIVNGDGNKLMPTGNAERCQVAAVIYRFYKLFA